MASLLCARLESLESFNHTARHYVAPLPFMKKTRRAHEPSSRDDSLWPFPTAGESVEMRLAGFSRNAKENFCEKKSLRLSDVSFWNGKRGANGPSSCFFYENN